MSPFYRSRAALVGLALAVASLGAVGFLPLFSGPGYESSLAAGLLLPFFVGVVTALETSAARPAPVDAFWKGIENGLTFAFVAYLTTIVHGLRAGFCDALDGSIHFALGPGAGSLIAGLWGAVAGEIAGRRSARRGRRAAAVILAVLGPLTSFGISGARFYTSPIVFAYDTFVGYFSGTLYDTIVSFSGLLTYRVGSAATLLFAGLLAASLVRTPEGRLHLSPSRKRGSGVILVAALAGSVACMAYGDRLFHWQTASTIEQTLGASWTGVRCDVVFPRGMEPDAVARFGRECDAHVARGEKWLGAPVPFRIKAFLFSDPGQKASLMGASNTYVAKPWRREIYVQEAGYPHPSLGHEIIHVLAGHFARGPFKVAGTAGGWLPDPGLIEGIAVAGSPPEGDLSPREWAKAMKDLGILPRLSRLFSLGFLNQSSATAYTVSGAFVTYVRERFGAEAVRAWYGGRSLPEATGAGLDELERAWHEDLDKVTLEEAARVQAKARFDKPAIFGRRCPRVVDECKASAEDLKGRGDYAGAIERYRAAIELDPGDHGLRVAMAKTALRIEGEEATKRALSAIAGDEAAPRHVRDKAIEELGDLALMMGRTAEAGERYREVRDRIVSEDVLRTLEVKIAAASGAAAGNHDLARRAVVELLIGSVSRGPDKLRATELLAEWAASDPSDGTPRYLLGRQAFGAGKLEEAAAKLDQALASRISVPRVRVEAERLRMIAACGLQDPATARRMLAAYTDTNSPRVSAARREAAESLVERCAGGGDPNGATEQGR